MIGGVITSTLLTLLVIPTFYEILAEWRDWLTSKLTGKPLAHAHAVAPREVPADAAPGDAHDRSVAGLPKAPSDLERGRLGVDAGRRYGCAVRARSVSANAVTSRAFARTPNGQTSADIHPHRQTPASVPMTTSRLARLQSASLQFVRPLGRRPFGDRWPRGVGMDG